MSSLLSTPSSGEKVYGVSLCTSFGVCSVRSIPTISHEGYKVHNRYVNQIKSVSTRGIQSVEDDGEVAKTLNSLL